MDFFNPIILRRILLPQPRQVVIRTNSTLVIILQPLGVKQEVGHARLASSTTCSRSSCLAIFQMIRDVRQQKTEESSLALSVLLSYCVFIRDTREIT